MVSKPSNLLNLLATKSLHQHQPSLVELETHISQARDALHDAGLKETSASGRFTGLYNAGHQFTLAAFKILVIDLAIAPDIGKTCLRHWNTPSRQQRRTNQFSKRRIAIAITPNITACPLYIPAAKPKRLPAPSKTFRKRLS